MDKTKLVSHFEGGGGGKREKKRGRRERRRKKRAKGMDFAWISLDTCIDFYGFV